MVFLLDEETQFGTGMVNSPDLGTEPESDPSEKGRKVKNLIDRSGDRKESVRKGY